MMLVGGLRQPKGEQMQMRKGGGPTSGGFRGRMGLQHPPFQTGGGSHHPAYDRARSLCDRFSPPFNQPPPF